MSRDLILLPALLQILLTLSVYLALNVAKARALRAGQVDPVRRGLHDDAWPDAVLKVNNNIRNQFELPVLFYVLVLMLWSLDAAGVAAQALAWGFALSRIAHAWVHTHSNYVPLRRRIFVLGVVLVLALLVLVAIRVATGG
jgi:hypothetical protein